MDAEAAAEFERQVGELYDQMARIAITPDWVRYYDFGAGRMPRFLQELADPDGRPVDLRPQPTLVEPGGVDQAVVPPLDRGPQRHPQRRVEVGLVPQVRHPGRDVPGLVPAGQPGHPAGDGVGPRAASSCTSHLEGEPRSGPAEGQPAGGGPGVCGGAGGGGGACVLAWPAGGDGWAACRAVDGAAWAWRRRRK